MDKPDWLQDANDVENKQASRSANNGAADSWLHSDTTAPAPATTTSVGDNASSFGVSTGSVPLVGAPPPPPTSSIAAFNIEQGSQATNVNQQQAPSAAATTTTTTDDDEKPPCCRNFNCKQAIVRDWRLLLATLVIIIVMNIPFLRYVLYPFDIFSTWIHEFCHGMAALMVGGSISQLVIYPDTSGLAYTSVPSHRGFVSSAGYQGTAVIGFLLLVFRRTKRGPRTGTMVVGIVMIVSVGLWIRNAFGIIMILILGILFCGCAWKLRSMWIRSLYIIVAVTTALNSITSVQDLFGSSHYVNGQPSSTDANTMGELTGTSSLFWALIWLFFSLLMTMLGIVFAIPGPDETADFQFCGVCIDLGLFRLCNDKNRWRGPRQTNGDGKNNSNATGTDNNNANNV